MVPSCIKWDCEQFVEDLRWNIGIWIIVCTFASSILWTGISTCVPKIGKILLHFLKHGELLDNKYVGSVPCKCTKGFAPLSHLVKFVKWSTNSTPTSGLYFHWKLPWKVLACRVTRWVCEAQPIFCQNLYIILNVEKSCTSFYATCVFWQKIKTKQSPIGENRPIWSPCLHCRGALHGG
jgi:hypothetical protein